MMTLKLSIIAVTTALSLLTISNALTMPSLDLTPDQPDTSASFANCIPASSGTCTIGLYLSWDSSVMIALVYDHNCEIIGGVDQMTRDLPTTLTAPLLRLPQPLTVTPHWDGTFSEFTYEGQQYQDWWTTTFYDDYIRWYAWHTFTCEARQIV
jgi:hypothetical protein